MKILITLFTLIFCWSAQAEVEPSKVWYQYQEILLPEVTQNRLNTKLKLLELVSLRQWSIVGQTFDSFEMSLKKCNVKISFQDKSIVISHDKFKINRNGFKNPVCDKRWLEYVAKDIYTTLEILSVQQEAIDLEVAIK